jgi:chloride channel protein, CIC family
VKSLMWTSSLGSGTSGGILAPQLMIGGGLGVALAHFFPALVPGAWPLICMAAVLAGSIGVPLTASVLAVELTHNSGLLLPLLLASMSAYGLNVLLQKRSILTERLAKRGYHLVREYGVDPMEATTVREVMHTSLFALPESATHKDAAAWYGSMQGRGNKTHSHWQRLFPLVSEEGKLVGVLTRSKMIEAAKDGDATGLLADDAVRRPVSVAPYDTLREAVTKMGRDNLTALPVVRSSDGRLMGLIQIADLLLARTKAGLRESERERVMRPRWPFARGQTAEAAAEIAVLDGNVAAGSEDLIADRDFRETKIGSN